MADTQRFVAIDLGAESGRVMIGILAAGRLELSEVHRFANEPVRLLGTLHWDLPRILLEIERGLRKAADAADGHVDGIAVDSWGVDYGLIDEHGRLVGNPIHYRDARTEGTVDAACERMDRASLFAETGVQLLGINTLFQLMAHQRDAGAELERATHALMTADLVTHFLCGSIVSERTLASTSQLWNPNSRTWSSALASTFDLPQDLFPECVEPGTVVGELRADIAKSAGFRSRPPLIATAAHDTASAVAAVPATTDSPWAFLSSGTWSLLGVELPGPVVNDGVLAAGFTNEYGVAGRTRFLKIITGLWLIQECRRAWQREDGAPLSYDTITELAEQSSTTAIVCPEHPDFFAPEDMAATIAKHAQAHGDALQDRGEIVRCALESLALTYAWTLDQARDLSGVGVERLHVVGGGSQNELLNRLTADATGIPVTAGPVEATAMGNVLVQAMAVGSIADIDHLRSVVSASTSTIEFAPTDAAAWQDKRRRFAANPRIDACRRLGESRLRARRQRGDAGPRV